MSLVLNVKIADAVFGVTPYIPAKFEDQTAFEGAVLDIYTKTYQVMSDVWEQGRQALVWNAETKRSEYKDWCVSGFVDATDEVKALYKQEQVDRKAQEIYQRQLDAAEAASTAMAKGDIVRVVSGRTAKGLVGEVVVAIIRPYGMGWQSKPEMKFAIAKDDVMVDVVAANGKTYSNHKNVEWVWALNCELAVTRTVEAIDKEAIWAEVAKDWDYKKEYA